MGLSSVGWWRFRFIKDGVPSINRRYEPVFAFGCQGLKVWGRSVVYYHEHVPPSIRIHIRRHLEPNGEGQSQSQDADSRVHESCSPVLPFAIWIESSRQQPGAKTGEGILPRPSGGEAAPLRPIASSQSSR